VIAAVRRLYLGESNFDVVGKTRLFLTISGVAILISIGSLIVKDLNLGIEFRGGSVWAVSVATDVGEGDVLAAAGKGGVSDARVQFVTEKGARKARVSSQVSEPSVVDNVKTELAQLPGASPESVDVTSVGPTWGSQISRKAVQALVIFLILVTVYISFRFEWKMAVAALAALIHDLVITAGVYSLVGFEVVPATVIASLTILGYSLYDTVVVFDKIQENTSIVVQTARQSYSETVNRSLNQVLMRSINTSLVTLLPVSSLLVVGFTATAGSVLKDFALALFVGLLCGAYSSIFFATPILALLKEREPRYQQIRARLESRAGREPVRTAVPARAARAAVRAVPDDRDEDATAEGEFVEEPAPSREAARAAQKTPARRPSKGGGRPRPKGKKRSGGKRRR
jgi:preprotein translocase subunit SecF